MTLSRRTFLQALGWTTGLLVVAGAGAYAFRPVLPYRGAPSRHDAAAWLRLSGEGLIEVLMPRAELGQGIAISFRQIVAEETGFALERVVAVQPRTDLVPPARATVGSDSLKDFGPLLAEAAVALAIVLQRRGSTGGAEPPGGWATLAGSSTLIDADDIARDGSNARSFARGEKRIVGTVQPVDAVRAMITGESPLYADDVRLPDMAFGAALRAPRLGEVIAGVDESAARGLRHYLGLFRVGERLFVAAETRGALERALAAIKVSFTGAPPVETDMLAMVDIDRGLADGAPEHGDSDARLAAGASFDLDLRLDVPMAAHACMEPRTAVAQFSERGDLTLWTGTQDVSFVRATLARELGLGEGAITVIGCRVGGAFGGKTIPTVEIEAALLARALKRPVKVQWSRGDEFRETFHRPPSSHRIRARVGPDGTLDVWHHAFRSGHVIFTSAAMGPALQAATSFIGDPGVRRGAASPYRARQARVGFEDVRLPVATGPWRGLGAAPNVWAIETAIDELARRRGEDPLAFRRRLIDPRWPRLARVLDRVASLADWPNRRSHAGRGYGIACGIYKEMSYAAVVAEVSREDAGMRITRLWCAHDCGLIVNPDQVRAQIEGNLVWSIGMALFEELTFADGHVAQANFGDYALPRFSDAPDMVIDLVEEGEMPSGAGETAIVAGTPAITNAIAAMTGKPVTRLPWRAGHAG